MKTILLTLPKIILIFQINKKMQTFSRSITRNSYKIY